MELTERTIDGYPITNITTPRLERVRRELNISLGLSVTGSPASLMIRRCRNAVAAELDRRAWLVAR